MFPKLRPPNCFSIRRLRQIRARLSCRNIRHSRIDLPPPRLILGEWFMPTRRRTAGSSRATPLPQSDRLAQLVDRPSDFRLVVDYRTPARMHRVVTITVRFEPIRPVHDFLDIHGVSSNYPPLAVRPRIPGAVVTPSETVLAPSASGPVEAVFHVTPLAHGESTATIETEWDGCIKELTWSIRIPRPGLAAILAGLTIVVTAVLHGLAQGASHVPAWLGRQALAWLPRTSWRDQWSLRFGEVMGDLARWVGEAHLSFWVFVAGLALACCLHLVRRPSREMIECGMSLPGSAARATTPPNYLTPVALSEVPPIG